MSHKKKGQLTVSGEWAKHLRKSLRRQFWKGERQEGKKFIRAEVNGKIVDRYNKLSIRKLRIDNLLYLCCMRQHNGMRPQDVAILLKIIAKANNAWQNKDLAAELFISPSEISESLNRSGMAGLLDADKKKKVFRQSLMEFLEHGLHYVFPALPGTVVNGVYTAHSHPFMQAHFASELNYVWPDARGEMRGLGIDPLYKTQVNAARQDDTLYLMLALVDVIRVGRVREINVATAELRKLIL